jgi:hypothetical protein
VPHTTKRQRVVDYVASRGWTVIGEAEWNELRLVLPDVSEHTLRDSGVEIEPPWCGVAQHSFEELEASLVELTEIYQTQPALRAYCRTEVITAKDHARLASLNHHTAEDKRQIKAEMVEWMLVWLDDPAMFPTWVTLRRHASRALSGARPSA